MNASTPASRLIPTALQFPVLLGLIFSSQIALAQPADLVLSGGKIVTLDARQPVAEALAIRGERIVASGSKQQIQPLVGGGTRVIDLAGQMVMPGFIEGHGHFFSLGDSKRKLDLSTAGSWQQIVELVAAEAARTPSGRWIVGRGWHQGKWRSPPTPSVQGYPTHEALSRLTPDHPVLLTHGTGHMSFANSKAMELAGITSQTAEIAGGEILRDSAGKPTGVFRENAAQPVQRAYAKSLAGRSAAERQADMAEEARLAAAECLRHGITTFQDAGSTTGDVDMLQTLARDGKLPFRLRVMLDDNNDTLARRLPQYGRSDAGGGLVKVFGIKRLLDGAIGTHGAWLLQPYDDLPQSTGNNTLPIASLERTAEIALEHKVQLCVHAIGDRANREVLDLYERIFQKHQVSGRELRWRIEHAQHLDPEDIPRFAKLGVIASMQANHATSDGPFVVSRLGERRAKLGAYAWRSLLDSGAMVINGTDTPVEPVNPLGSFYASISRRMANGEAFFPEQSMSRLEALRSYTTDAAYAAFEEQDVGTLTPGKLADIVVLSQDLLAAAEDQILKTTVRYTIVGGKIVYEAN